MKPIVFLLPGLMSLAACGGAGDEGEFIVSSGVFDSVELPAGADLQGLPDRVQDTVRTFQTLNESGSPTTTLPGGTATYSGTFGIGVDDGEGGDSAVLDGDLNMTADFAALTFNGTASNFTVADPDGNPLSSSGTLAVATTIRNNSEISFDGTMSGDLTVGGEGYRVNGLIDGAFSAASADQAFGLIDGSVDNPDSSSDEISGVFVAERN